MPTNNNDQDFKYRITKESKESNGNSGYPQGDPIYQSYDTSKDRSGYHELTPEDHFLTPKESIWNTTNIDDQFYKRATDHSTRDLNDPETANKLRNSIEIENGETYAKFNGSTTIINPLDDPNINELMAPDGFRNRDIQNHIGGDPQNESTAQRNDPPISPLEPFTSLHPTTAQNAILHYYNRTKLPIADAEWRKGFRHIFITRPECYIMANDGNKIRLSEQCMHDKDFYSAFMRVPHLCRLLSPVYVTGSFSKEGWQSNWNYLLTNRVLGMSTTQVQLEYDENIQKSIEGFTIMPAKLLVSEQGSTIELSFRDTRNMEVYECLRLWMLYGYKCKRGILAPSYNGYEYSNGFLTGLPKNGSGGTISTITQQLKLHPYDRALDYCATLFDIVTNESGTKILYWCKYYGIYPVSLSNHLSNQRNEAITGDATISAGFKYHKKKEYDVSNLIEFNYNAGICDSVGKVVKSAQSSLPFLLRSNEEYAYQNYIGASEMFTGSPYIVMETAKHDAVTETNISVPYLRFAHIQNSKTMKQLNMGLESYEEETSPILSY